MYNNDSEVEVTENEFDEIVKNGHKLVVVDFFAEWCMPCVMVAPIIEDLAKADSMKDVKFTKINIDDNGTLARKYNISTIPCLVIFKDGKEVDRIIGNQPADVIESTVKNYL
jgi:thioredoxin 1|tara:strand:- start:270 stop:605 length:336 start_codon:yes stop_codon:yes gene_type:complete